MKIITLDLFKNFKMLSHRERTQQIERRLGLLAVLTIIAAWIIGGVLKGSAVDPYLPQALPTAAHFSKLSSGIYAGEDANNQVIGYVGVGEASGYGGPMQLAVAVDLEGQIIGLALVDHKETPSYLERVFRDSFISDLLGKSYDQSFQLGSDLDGVTSATYSSAAIAEAVKLASRQIAGEELNLVVPAPEKPQIIFGLPEIILILLFVVGYLGRRRVIKKTKVVRWATLLTGMVVLGFIYNRPITLSKLNMFLMGYFPQWQTNLYWYLLLGGILFVFTADNRNPYCEWFCPFGAAQECMGAIGGAKPRFSREQQRVLDWVQRGLSWLAIVVALLLRNPGVTSYEIFGTLFAFTGGTLSFAVLGIVLIGSMISHRFWCRTLCPVRPVEGIIRLVRKWILEIWQTKIITKKTT
jgi:Na+-translocating ferredoxin:NAD+ oxidoreductase RnfG subunit